MPEEIRAYKVWYEGRSFNPPRPFTSIEFPDDKIRLVRHNDGSVGASEYIEKQAVDLQSSDFKRADESGTSPIPGEYGVSKLQRLDQTSARRLRNYTEHLLTKGSIDKLIK